MSTSVSIHDARSIMNGHFIERWKTITPPNVPTTKKMLEEARERGFFLGYVPEGSLGELEEDMLQFLGVNKEDPIRRRSTFTSRDAGYWCLLQVSDAKSTLPLKGKPVRLLPFRDVVFLAHSYANSRYERLWTENALVAGGCHGDGMSPEWLIAGFPGRLTIEGTSVSGSALRYQRRIVGVRFKAS